jgi:hypothetical protein
MKRTRALPPSVPLRLAITVIGLIVTLAATDVARAIERIKRAEGFNGAVHAISEPDASGTRYLGGEFTDFAPWNTGHGALTDPITGAIDPSLVSIDGGSVLDVESDGAGGVFVAGEFTEINGQVRRGLARIQSDGSLDPSWTSGLTNAGGYVKDLELSGGVLYAVGRFATVATPTAASTQRSNAAAFNAATGALTDWNPATRANTDTTSVSVDARRGYAYLGGNFTCVNARPAGDCSTTADNNTVTALARVDLARGDMTLFPGLGGGTINDSVLSADGDWLYIGGDFSVGGRSNAAVIRADSDSLTLGSWAPALPTSGGQVLALEPLGTSIYIGGGFVGAVGGQQIRLLARFTADPTAAATLTLAPAVSGSSVNALRAVGSDIAIGGHFSTVAGEFRRNAARLTSLGAVTAWNPHPSGGVNAIGELGSGIFIGGPFVQAGGHERLYAAAVNRFGELTDWTADVSGIVRAAAVGDDAVYLGGDFQSAEGGATRKYAAAFTTGGTLTPWDPDLNANVNTIAVSNGVVYLGGAFYDDGASTTRNYAAAFTTNGVLTSWDPDLDGNVNTIAVSNGVVYLGGEFAQVGGPTTRNHAAAFTTNGVLTSWDPDLDGNVNTIAVSNGVVYLGGSFYQVGGSTTRNYAAAFTTGGTLTPWDPDLNDSVGTDDPVWAIAHSGSTVFIGGQFTDVGGQPRPFVAATDASTGAVDPQWNPNPGTSQAYVRAIRISDSTVFLGGDFTQLGSTPRRYSAAVSTSGTILDPWPGPLAFTAQLTVAKAGTGSGTVTSTPSGIDCGSTCSARFTTGTSITLTAAPTSGSTFAGWSGGCSGTASTCSITVDQERSVTATFTTSGQAASPSTKPKTTPTLRVVSARASGASVVLRVRTNSPGQLRVTGTVPSSQLRAARTTVCTGGRTAKRSGVIALVCPLNSVGRSLLAGQSLVVRLTTTYTPRQGAKRTAIRSVRLPMMTPSVTPVTG